MMSKISDRLTQMSPLKQALLALEEMSSKLEKIERQQTEPIAIVGMGCRFPGGANDPESFWQLLDKGVDAIQEVPRQRWNINNYYDPNPEVIGKAYTREGGFLEIGIDEFDAEFFGLAPREVVMMDPQQRLLLEVSWEALENAGIAPDKLIGSKTGIFVGINTSDYAQLYMKSRNTADLNAYFFTGNTSSVAAGRLSYILGLQGPSIALDTACSSSLVTVHLACQSLRTGECRLALAGGVNLMLSPEPPIVLSRMRALAADGRCKTFDATADGYGRGEGCGIVVLKRLSDAITDGDNILALIRGSAINHDGCSSGLTVPNGVAQQKLIRAALENGKVEPNAVSYVEVHGTGTALGDPIEVEALATVLGKGRLKEQSLLIGSVKTNIGHLEAAAGIAGLIKVVLAMQHGGIPAHLHLKNPNPSIAWENLPVTIPTKWTPWVSQGEHPRLAGISSFGMSGTNAHLVLEEAPVQSLIRSEVEQPLHLLALSAKTEVGLKTLVDRFESYLQQNPLKSLGDICFTANTGRSHFAHRLVVVGKEPTQILAQLAALKAGQVFSKLVSPTTQPRVAFLFTGQGSEYLGMGRELYETQPTFRRALERCDELLRSYLEQSLVSLLYSPSQTSDRAADAQLALFALEYALFQLWQSWGIEPAVVIGHGVGEYVAACVAGVFSLEDGFKLIVQSGRPRYAGVEQAEVKYSLPRIPIISALTGNLVEEKEIAQGEYWCRPITETIKLTDSIQTLQKLGYELFVEISPHPTLLPQEGNSVWLTSLRQGHSDWQQLLHSLGELYVRGVEVDWCGFHRDYLHRRLQLPTYPFERSRYWIESVEPELSHPFDDWLYQVEWQTKPRVIPELTVSAGRWLIFADRNHSMGFTLATLLEERGETCNLVFPGETYEIFQEGHYQINPTQPQHFQRLLQEISETDGLPWRGIVHCWSLDSTAIAQTTVDLLQTDQARNCGSVLHLVQALSIGKIAYLPRLWLITQGTQPIELSPNSLAVAQTPMLGLGRVIAVEHPEIWGGLVDLAPGNSAELAATLLEEICQPDGESEIAFRQRQRYVPRLVHRAISEVLTPTLQLQADRTYLLTGGLGGLGIDLAQWMIDQGARNLVLVGRRSATDYTSEQISKLRAMGANIVVAQADISVESEVQRVLADIAQSLPPLAGIIHLAGVLDDGVLLRQDWERFAKVMAPKVAGAWNLHSQTQDLALDFFVLFSSIASLLGSPGQGNYSAANAFLDGLAHYRRSLQLPALSINWSPWGETGMAAGLGHRGEQRWTAAGISVIAPQQGLAVLKHLLSQSDTQIGILPVNWLKFFEQIAFDVQPPLFSKIADELRSQPTADLLSSQGRHELLEQLKVALPKQRPAILTDHIQKYVNTILGHNLSRLPEIQLGFFEMGMDSLMLLELKNRLQTSLGCSLSSTLTYEYPTIESLAGYLLNEVLALGASFVSDIEFQEETKEDTRILAEIENLSVNELEVLLDQELAILIGRN